VFVILMDMAKGLSFPAIVLKSDLLILAGNQRANAAMEAGRTTVDAYVVKKMTEAQQDDFIRRDNNRHGKD
jgi:ParB-like chromosome segregation protein Spo0J